MAGSCLMADSVKAEAARSSGARPHCRLVAEAPRFAAVVVVVVVVVVVGEASAGRIGVSRCSAGVEGSCCRWMEYAELGVEGRIAMGPSDLVTGVVGEGSSVDLCGCSVGCLLVGG